MGAVIAYDKPVVDFIDELSATGHVTHTAYRKTSVTLHHNGGRLSLQGILDVWKVRPASAHFQVDGQGALGQYVKVNEYAWATGNTQGNKESISIELANATMAPDYLVAEVTMMEGARLAGWLFARVIGVAPSRDNFHVHHDWKATLCAGPCIDANYNRLLEQAQVAYLYFTGQGGAPSPSPSTPSPTTPVRRSNEQIAREVIAGSWGNGTDRQNRLRSAGYDPALIQATVNAIVYGKPIPSGPAPAAPAAPARKSLDQIASEVIAGDWGNNPQRSVRLQNAGYNPSEVQAAVNSRLGVKAGGNQPVRLSVSALADQVIAGSWGKGNERRSRLTAAGYNYAAVQAEVNRRLL